MEELTLSNNEILTDVPSDKHYSLIKLIINDKVILTPESLNKFYLITLPGGSIIIFINKSLGSDYTQEAKMNLKFAGYKLISIKEEDYFIISGVNKSDKKHNENKAEESLNISKWKLNENSTNELIPENELINPNDLYEKFSKGTDCITKPKPCKNCNCGRAKENSTTNIQQPKSECGKCYLGDAFRCEGCPYRGLPAFEPGQKITLSNNDTVQNLEKEEVKVVSQGNKIKLDI